MCSSDLRAAVRKGITHGYRFRGILKGGKGMMECDWEPLGLEEISGILPKGGTILGTSRTNPFKEEDGGEIVVVADAGDHRIAIARGLLRGRRLAAAMALHPGVGLGRRPVVDGHLMPRLRKMPCHGRAHDAQPDECYFRHGAPA